MSAASASWHWKASRLTRACKRLGLRDLFVKILLIPFGSHGDVHPFVGIGTALRDRGHDVVVITSGYFEGLVRRVGLGFVSLGTAEDFEKELNNPDVWHPRKGLSLLVHRSILPALRTVYNAVASGYVPGETVVAAGSLALGARIAQEKLGVPLASVHLQPAMFRSEYRAPILSNLFMPDWLPHFAKRIQYWLGDRLVIDRLLGPGVNRFRAELGLPPAHRFFGDWWHSPQRIIGLFPDWFGPPQPDWPPQVRLTGFPLYDEHDLREQPAGLAEFLNEGEPPIVFTPGSAMRHGQAFFAAAVEACRLLGRRGLLLSRFRENLPPELPDGIRHFDYVPFSQVLPRAAALVHHGGIGTTAQGLAAGIPQLVMPLAYDQADNADRVRRLGAGQVLPPRAFRAAPVARLLGELLGSAEVAARCREFARRSREGMPLDEACRAIEGLSAPS
jgi:UDP:flavonoid glycosyltransferase YjiC (YdhE family)